ncbi:hypothetical protein CBR_g38702 [Chara braunii]|uniref:DUF659 domain-containing protein n=1 Tax=Chara braunii TaxID=69332 RepID=A0A388LQ11_CHABU|nr:hypothetical protein CBR_g38702 [Chara braunii]|eukprot:GBG84418.1 hypothetical protein CBR_g38702 [Chara braunii]
MGRAQRHQHEAAVDHVHVTFRARSPVYRYLVVGQKVDNKGVMMLCCTFCNKVFQGTQFQATRHFSQTNYCKDISDEALYEIARRSQQKFEADQMERVARYAAEHGRDVPDTGCARGGEAGRRPVEGGVGGDGWHGAPDPTLGGGGGETEEGVIHVDRKARGPSEEGVPEQEDVPDGVSFNAFRNQAWKAYQQVLLEQPGSSPRAVLPNHSEIASMRAVETHRAELAEELEEVRQPFWVIGATLLSDGRKSRDRRPIVNFLAAGSRGVVVYTTINREGEADDAVHRVATIVHIMQPVIKLLRRMDCGGQYMSLMIEWTQDLVRRVTDACAPLGKSFANRIIRRVQARTQHMLEPAHCGGFLLKPRRRHVRYFSGQVDRYDAWLVGQAKRYILTQMGFELEGAEYILACREFEDFHIQQGKFGDWGRPEGRARGRACSGDSERIECTSWWSQFGSGAPELQRCTLRVMHMWSCASPAERNWAVHEGIHTKKCNQLAFEKVVQLVEINANVRLTEYRRAGYGLELEPVCSGTRRGMTEEEIARQVALITWDPIGASAPPSSDAVFDRRACIFRPYPREDDSDEETVPEAADDPALRIPREIEETHEDPDSKETRAHCTTGGRLGGEGDAGGRGGVLGPIREELGSSLPEHGLLHRGGAVRQLRLRSPSPGILQEEGAPSAATVESSVAPAAVPDATIAATVEEIAAAAAAAVLEEMAASVLEEDPPAAGGGAGVEGQVAEGGGASGGAAAVVVEVAAAAEEEEAPSAAAVEGEVPGPVEEEIAAQAEVQRGGDDERLMQQFLTEELDPVIAEEARRREIEGDCVQGGVVAGEDVAKEVAAEPVPEAMPGEEEAADVAVEGRPQAVDEGVQAGQRQVKGAIDARREVQETATGPVISFSGLHLTQARQSQAV